MALTITLKRELAERLRSQAEARNLSVQEWALTILATASERPDYPETWTDLNARRLALIQKRYRVGLSEAEDKELATLQNAAAEVFEPADRRRFDHLRALVHKATGSTDG
jgi:hypothetical protein